MEIFTRRITIDPNPSLRGGLKKPYRKILAIMEREFPRICRGEIRDFPDELIAEEAGVGSDTVRYAYTLFGALGITKMLLPDFEVPVSLPAPRCEA